MKGLVIGLVFSTILLMVLPPIGFTTSISLLVVYLLIVATK